MLFPDLELLLPPTLGASALGVLLPDLPAFENAPHFSPVGADVPMGVIIETGVVEADVGGFEAISYVGGLDEGSGVGVGTMVTT